MKYLIPPSEGKAKIVPQEIKFKDTDFIFKNKVKDIVALLELLEEEDLQSIYGTSPEKSLYFHRQNEDVFNSRCAHAIERYSGVVYKNLEWSTLKDTRKEFFNNNFLIFSGLFGMVAPMTLIPNYKLKMSVLSLQNFWSETITKHLSSEDTIFDLLPQAHRKAYKPSGNVVNVDFMIIKKGKKTAAGHFGKSVKGKFIRYVCQNKITKTDDFSGFTYDGFKWDGNYFIKEE